MLLIYLFNLHQQISLDHLRKHARELQDYAVDHPVLTPLLFVGIYILSVMLIIPDSIILSLVAGFIFSMPLGILYSLFSETAGAFIFFSAAQLFEKKMTRPGFVNKIQREFRESPASYLLFFRISHILPYWVVNVGAALFDTPRLTFVWTTIVGIIPLTYLLVDAGHHLSNVLAHDGHLVLADVFSTENKIILIALGLLTLSPVLYKKWKK